MRKKENLTLFIIFFSAFLLRLLYIHFVGFSTLLAPDSYCYLEYVKNILNGNGYLEGKLRAFRPPGYPFFITFIFYILGQSITILKIIQAFLSSFIPLIIYFIGIRILNKKYALFAAIFSIFYFGFIQEPSQILSEALFTPLFSLFVLFLLKTKESKYNFFILGIILALTSMTRPIGLLLIPFTIIWIFIKFYREEYIKKILFVLLTFSVVLLPWWIRNYKIFHKFVPVALETGFVFQHAYSPIYKDNKEYLNKIFENDKYEETERDKRNFNKGLYLLKQMSCKQLLKKWTINFLHFFYPFQPTYDVTYMLIFPFFIYGFYIILKKKDIDAMVLFAMLVYLPVATFFFTAQRYRHSVSVSIILIAFYGFKYINEKYLIDNKKENLFKILISIWFIINISILFYQEEIRFIVKKFIKLLIGA